MAHPVMAQVIDEDPIQNQYAVQDVPEEDNEKSHDFEIDDYGLKNAQTNQDYDDCLLRFHDAWIPPNGTSETDLDLHIRYRQFYGAKHLKDCVRYDHIRNIYNHYVFLILKIEEYMETNNMLSDHADEEMKSQRIQLLCQIKEAIIHSYNYFGISGFARYIRSPQKQHMLPPDLTRLWSWMPNDTSTYNSFQILCSYLVHQAYLKGYRKDNNGWVYEQVEKSTGVMSSAWKKIYSMSEFVHSSIPNEMANPEIWKASTDKQSNREGAERYLKGCVDPKFPFIQRTRYKIEFKNGVYYTNQCLFVANEDRGPADFKEAAMKYIDQDFNIIRYLKEMHSQCSNDAVCRTTGQYNSCATGDPMNIETSHIELVFDKQGFSKELRRLIYGLGLGRLLESCNIRDRWQFFVLFIGKGGTAKSTLLKLVQEFFDPTDVGTMENKMNQDFAIGYLMDKYVTMATDAVNTNNWDITTLNKMVEGAPMSKNLKNKDIICNYPWTQHIAIASNRHLIKDIGGCLDRRQLPVMFNRVVADHEKDPQLFQKMTQDLGAVLFKITLLYDWYVRNYGHKEVWSFVPQEIRDNRRDLRKSASSMDSFLNSTNVVTLDPNGRCLYDDFVNAYNLFCGKHNMAKESISSDILDYTFRLYNIEKEENGSYSRVVGGLEMVKGDWLHGVTLKSNGIMDLNTLPKKRHFEDTQDSMNNGVKRINVGNQNDQQQQQNNIATATDKPPYPTIAEFTKTGAPTIIIS